MINVSEMTTAERVHYGISKATHEAAQVTVLDKALSGLLTFNQARSIPRLTLPIWASVILALGAPYVV